MTTFISVAFRGKQCITLMHAKKKKNLFYSRPSFNSPLFSHLFVSFRSTPCSLVFLFFLLFLFFASSVSLSWTKCLLQDLPNFPTFSPTAFSVYWCQSLCIWALINIIPEPIKRPNWMRRWKRMDALTLSWKSSVPGSVPSLPLTDDTQHYPYSFLSQVSMMAATTSVY